MSKKNPPPDEDLFKQAMKQVRPLKKTNTQLHQKPKTPSDKKIKRDNASSHLSEPFQQGYSAGHSPYRSVHGSEVISFCRDFLPKTLVKQLKQGKIPPDDSLDLHSYTVAAAEQEVDCFLANCYRKNHYCVVIIHGKGHLGCLEQPILKNFINDYLRHFENVLAFHTAKPRHGGEGAVYVLLKSNKEGK